MKRIILCLSLFAFFGSQAQQINPVPDYVFRNQMSVGRNAVTDTAAYISIGPRYGANKGLMPPIVSDTAAITGVKRNGLLIFSVQRNNFQYWDSINSRWTSVTANVDTTVISTRAWRKKGDDSLGAVIATKVNISDTATMLNPYTRGSGTVNYVPKFTTTRTLGNSLIFDNGTNVGIGTTSPGLLFDVNGTARATTYNIRSGGLITDGGSNAMITPTSGGSLAITSNGTFTNGNIVYNALAATGIHVFQTNSTERLRIFANGRVGINTTTDAGAYALQVAGSIYNTNDAYFGVSSGRLGVGTSTGAGKISSIITGVVSPTNAAYWLSHDGSAGSTDGLAIGTNGSASYKWIQSYNGALSINSAGNNVGIGTTSPSEVLDVNGRIRARTIDSTSSPINVLTSDVNGVIRKTAPGVQGSGTTNYVAKFTASGTVGNSQLIDNGTNVSLGTVIRLDNVGGIASNATGNFVSVKNSSVNGKYVQMWAGTSGSVIDFDNTGFLMVSTSSPSSAGSQSATTELARMTNSGELLINTTTDVGDYRLQVNGNANFRDDVLIDTNLRVNRHISLDQTPKAWALGNAIEGPQGSTLFVAGGGVQTLANVYYDGSYKYSTSNPGAAMFLLQSGITFATYGSGTANGALTGANEMVYAGGELRVGIADQGTFKLQVADKSYLADEVQIASTTDLGNYKLQVTGEAIITAGIRTDAPSGGTAATWKLGTVATVSPTSPNRTIEVEIGGTTYYIHAKTTNN